MAKRWHGLRKACEECAELIVELMKLEEFPSGNHPGRGRSLIKTAEEECADVLAAVEFFIEANKLDRNAILKRKQIKYDKFVRWFPNKKRGKK